MWKLKVQYTHLEIEATEDLTFQSAEVARCVKDKILREGLYLGRVAHRPGVLHHELWLAPSQIISFEIIEYEGE